MDLLLITSHFPEKTINRNEDLIHLLLFSRPLLGLVWFSVFTPQDTVSTDTLPSLREIFPCLQARPPQTFWTPLGDNKSGVDVRQGMHSHYSQLLWGTRSRHPIHPVHTGLTQTIWAWSLPPTHSFKQRVTAGHFPKISSLSRPDPSQLRLGYTSILSTRQKSVTVL